MIILLLLFLASGAVLALLTWAELPPDRQGRRATVPATPSDAPAPDISRDTELPRVRGFAPGILLELELDGPAPVPGRSASNRLAGMSAC